MIENVTFQWEDYSCGFKCDLCGEEIIFSEMGPPETCKCGRSFKLWAYVEEIK